MLQYGLKFKPPPSEALAPGPAAGRGAGQVGVALIGCGRWGSNIARVLDALVGAELVCVVDPCARAFENIATFEEACRSPQVDAVIIATPPDSHAPLALAALEAGKHVFIEKPIALRSEDVAAVRLAADSMARRVMVGHLLLYHTAVQSLVAGIAEGRLGGVVGIESERLGASAPSRREGVLWTVGPHEVSLAAFVCGGSIVEVSARACDGHLPFDAVELDMRLEGGVWARSRMSCVSSEKRRRLVVRGTHAVAVFIDEGARVGLHWLPVGVGRAQLNDLRADDDLDEEPLAIEMRRFVECVAGGRAVPSDLDEGARVTRTLEAAQESLDGDGRRVPVT